MRRVVTSGRAPLRAMRLVSVLLFLGLAAPSQVFAAAEAETPVLVTPGSVGSGLYRESPVTFESVSLHHHDLNINRIGPLVYSGGLVLNSDDDRFGGLSGLQLSPDGRTMLAVSDKGYWVGATLDYDERGQLAGVRNVMISPLLGLDGQPLNKDNKADADAEDLVEIPGSGIVVSFEGKNRLWHYGATLTDVFFGKKPHPLPLPVDVAQAIEKLPRNGAIEAMTHFSPGTLFVVAEDANKNDDLHDAWLIGLTQVAKMTYRSSDNFKPTGLSVLPNGDVLVLERRFTLMQGLATRLKRLRREQVVENAVLEGEEIATLAFPYNIDNMEGLFVREGDYGETLIYLVSDNNYNPLQRTMLMMFRLEE
jgi:hypothetical protein